jgi:hypothetical protein
MTQLVQRLRRCNQRRASLQIKWQKLQDKLATAEKPEERKALQVLIDAHDRAVKFHLDPRIEVFEDEIARRQAGA